MMFLKMWATGIWFVVGALLLAAQFRSEETSASDLVLRVVFGVGLIAAAVVMWL